MNDAVKRYVKERNDALRKLDMEWARKMLPDASSDHVRLMAMHKARYEATGIEKHLRLESQAWLQDHGYGRMCGIAFDPEPPINPTPAARGGEKEDM